MNSHVHYGIVHNCQDMESSEMSISYQINKENMSNAYN